MSWLVARDVDVSACGRSDPQIHSSSLDLFKLRVEKGLGDIAHQNLMICRHRQVIAEDVGQHRSI